jgi:hypothetical protein
LYGPHAALHALLTRSGDAGDAAAAAVRRARVRAEGAYLALRRHLGALKAAVRCFEAAQGA